MAVFTVKVGKRRVQWIAPALEGSRRWPGAVPVFLSPAAAEFLRLQSLLAQGDGGGVRSCLLEALDS
jgi:hypothetical protein